MNRCNIATFALKPILLMKTQVYFRFRDHPGDLFRSSDVVKLTDPDIDLDAFLVQFLPNYQSCPNVAYLNNLYKLFHDEFIDNEDKESFLEIIGDKSLELVDEEIKTIRHELYVEALRNFYQIVLNNKIEIINESRE